MTKNEFIENATAEKAELLKKMRVLFSLAQYPTLVAEDNTDTCENIANCISEVEESIDTLTRLLKMLNALHEVQADLECNLDEYEWDE
jgi:hypothetical protein